MVDPDTPSLWVSAMPSVHKLRRKPPVVDRIEWLEDLAAGKDVVHLGFLDAGRTEDKRASATWLHERLSRTATKLTGIDLDPEGVANARAAGYEAQSCDLEDPEAVLALNLSPAELVIAGELIEHLDRPGPFLEAVKPLVADHGALVLTTPNAVSLTNFLVALGRREWSSPHHVSMYSWRTLAALLERHDWNVRDVLFYYRGERTGPEAKSRPGLAAAFNLYERATRPVLRRFFPTLADGLIVVADRKVAGG